MAIFLDSGNIAEVKKYMGMGIIRGVSTNPTILYKDGLKEGRKERIAEIVQGMIVHPYSKETVQMFLRDAANINGEKNE